MQDIFDLVQDLKPEQIIILNKPKFIDKTKFNKLLLEVYEKKPYEIWTTDSDLFREINYKHKVLMTLNQLRERVLEKYNLTPKVLIGVTGSFGKSSTCEFLYQILNSLGFSVFLSCSSGIKGKNNTKNSLTTPGFATLRRLLHENHQCDFGIIECSSQAIEQERLFGLNFDSGIFTGFCEDHLDVHETLEEYFNIKKKFIESINGPKVVLNSIDINGDYYHYPSETFKIIDNNFLINNQIIQINTNIEFFQKVNLLGALVLLHVMKIPLLSGIDVHAPKGRIEFIGENLNGAKIYLDGCHSSDQVDLFLYSVKADYFQSVIVYGASAKRLKTDLKTKNILSKFQKVIITDDNPCHIPSMEIIDQLRSPHHLVISNRFEAIKKAIEIGTERIFILGKGSETSNIIEYNDYSIVYDEATVIKELLRLQKYSF
jgi:UDP-N-acetylmuramoyl-L-alanyl-D-glutamate--2,6-diaminopimelate ligase